MKDKNIDFKMILEFLEENAQKEYGSPENTEDLALRKSYEELREKAQIVMEQFKAIGEYFKQFGYIYDKGSAGKWLDGTYKRIRGYFWIELKKPGKENFPTSISIIAEKKDKLRFIIYIESKNQNCNDLAYKKHFRYLDKVDVYKTDFQFFGIKGIDNLNKEELKMAITNEKNRKNGKIRMGKSFDLKSIMNLSMEEVLYEFKETVDRLEPYYDIAVEGDDNLTEISNNDRWNEEINRNNENFLARKRTDYSCFNNAITIPVKLHEKFLGALSKGLKRGEKVPVKLFINDKEFKAIIRYVNMKANHSNVIQIIYQEGKKIQEVLRNNLDTSYDYIMDYLEKNGKTPNNMPEEYCEFIDFYKGEEKDTFIIELISKTKNTNYDAEEEIDYPDIIAEEAELFTEVENIEDELNYINKFILTNGFYYEEDLIKNFYLSLRTKPFVILSGISGTGKSKIVELFAAAVGATFENGRFNLVPVKPEWSDATDLLGYRNIEGQFTPGIITKIAYEAMKNSDKPYFICLDEMNLARVEYFFSDILSLMETRRKNEDGEVVTEKLLSPEQFGRDERAKMEYGDVYLTENLYIVGTVNMDETTFPFSKKVLDRANTIEFNKVDLSYNFDDNIDVLFEEIENKNYKNDFLKSEYLKLANCKEDKEIAIEVIEKLKEINTILEEYNQHFGYRVRDEIVFYMIYAVKHNLLSFEKAFDICVVQKVLPKLSGSNNDVLEILIKLFNLFNETNYKSNGYFDESEMKELENNIKESFKISSEKIIYMIRRFVRDGFTSFWQ